MSEQSNAGLARILCWVGIHKYQWQLSMTTGIDWEECVCCGKVKPGHTHRKQRRDEIIQEDES